MTDSDVVLAGGGLAGLVAALELSRAGHRVVLIERKTYPFHKVCGEYISNEVRPYLSRLGLDLATLGVADIRQFTVSAPSGRQVHATLDLGGFGISRYRLDDTLYRLGLQAGVRFMTGHTVGAIRFANDVFTVELADGTELTSRLVIGTFGKRSRLDKSLDRAFMHQPSPYVGVKYHVRMDFPTDLIALHNFDGGYCGMSAIEDDRYCVCYLTSRQNLRTHGSIPAMEQAVLYRNPHLKQVFTQADFLFDKPEVINEVSFARKEPVEGHILMAGDAAGLITPLCGNGMAMAIHGAKLVSGLSDAYLTGQLTRPVLEQQYRHHWTALFARRLWVGRTVQQLFGSPRLSDLAVQAFSLVKPALRQVMRQTHGRVIEV